MAIGAGKSSSKSSSKTDMSSNTNYDKTMTPTNPEWVTSGAQGLAGQVVGLAGQNPQSFVAGPTAQTQGFLDAASGIGQSAQGLFGQAANLASGATGAFGYNPAEMQAAQIAPTSLAGTTDAVAERAYTGIDNYTNPHEQTVINNTMMDLNRARQLTQNSNGQGAMAAGQYGSSRQGVLDANADEGFLRSVGDVAGKLRHQGFTTAIGAADADASRGTQVGLANAGAANQASLFNAGAQNQQALSQAQLSQQAAGANQAAKNSAWSQNATANDAAASRQLQAAGLFGQLGQAGMGIFGDAAGMSQQLAQSLAQAPLEVKNALIGMFGNLPLNLFQGGTEAGTEATTGTSATKGKQSGFSVAGSYGG